MKILRIEAVDTYPIRQLMLRPKEFFKDCSFDGDDHELTFHLGTFTNKGKLVAIASFYYENNSFLKQKHQFRLRGMATLPEFQGLGYSKALLKQAFPLIRQSFCEAIWCNARKEAYGFYKKVGFDFKGREFFVPDIGPHTLMTKQLIRENMDQSN